MLIKLCCGAAAQGGAYSLCEVCNLQLTSAAQAQLHLNGRSHLRRVRQLQAGETPKPSITLINNLKSIIPSPSLFAGSGCGPVGGALPGLVAGGGPSVMMKPFLSFPVETTSPVGLFPNFNTMDPVQKAVINHTFGVSMAPKKKQVISCNICQLRFNSDSQAEAHYKGSRHAKKLKAQENKAKSKLPISGETNGTGSEPPPSSPPSASPAPGLSTSSSCKPSPPPPPPPPPAPLPLTLTPVTSSSSSSPPPSSSLLPPPQASQAAAAAATPPPPVESEEEKAKKLLYCSLCKVAVNSLSQLEAHNTGSKHKTMLEARSGAGPIKAYPRPGAKLKNQSSSVLKGSGLQNKTFHCQICDVHVNSEIQLKQHISSRRHKDRVAGKPSKPKYSPYNKQQRSALTNKLALQKDLVKPSLSPSFLSSPFCPSSSPLLPPSSLASSITLAPSSSPLLPASSSPLSPTISLHPRPTSSLFPPSFLRPAPGPIRTTQGSILFTPY
uniref:Zinc finger protein 385B n=1 Tax=Myripristis murdjan TaxID=586833 RepID=A0A667WW07_9TELE